MDHPEFVRTHTRIGAAPLVPEVKLYLSDDAFSLWERTEEEIGAQDQQPPFWGFAWPGGQALARYVLDHRSALAGRTVLDLGAGCGLPGHGCLPWKGLMSSSVRPSSRE